MPPASSLSHAGPFAIDRGLRVDRTRLWLDGNPRGDLAWVPSVDDWPSAPRGRLILSRELAALHHREAERLHQLVVPAGQPLRLGPQTLMLLPAGWPGASQLQLHSGGETWLVVSRSRLHALPGSAAIEVRESAQVLLYCPPPTATSALDALQDWLVPLQALVKPVLAVATPGLAMAVAAVWPGEVSLSRKVRAALRGWQAPAKPPSAAPALGLVLAREATTETPRVDPAWQGDPQLGFAFSLAAAGDELDALLTRLAPRRLLVWGEGAAALAARRPVEAILHTAGQLRLLP